MQLQVCPAADEVHQASEDRVRQTIVSVVVGVSHEQGDLKCGIHGTPWVAVCTVALKLSKSK